jgi:hypothetical protein
MLSERRICLRTAFSLTKVVLPFVTSSVTIWLVTLSKA